jgi:ketosteroid isomerase-like protein
MFTKDAVRSNADGQTQTGNDEIVAAYEELFQNKLTVTIKQEKVTTENNTTVSNGTYRATGSSASGESFDVSGTFIHTMVKENGKWKISKQDLRSL